MPPILMYALRRLVQAVPVVILIMIATFLLLKLAPGDTVDALVGDMAARMPPLLKIFGSNMGWISRFTSSCGDTWSSWPRSISVGPSSMNNPSQKC